MAQLWGREWTKRALLERVGDLDQIAGVEAFTYRDGVRDGVHAVRVRTGGGLEFTVLVSRGMDIAHASFKGVPLAWVSQTSQGHPHGFEPEGRGWLRTFGGGLLTTCGLGNAGAAGEDDGEALGLHGRISHAPAEQHGAWTEWDGDEAQMVVAGTLREAQVFDENLRLVRKITAPLGGNSLRIEDRVENLGWKTSPLMLLYHLNFGWPLVGENTEVMLAARKTEARDAVAEAGIATWNRLHAPHPDYNEQCFFHDAIANNDGTVPVLMINRGGHPLGNVGVQIQYTQAMLPHLTQWKMMGQGEYVCGIEPANCRVLGRARERAAGRLETIAPGEVRHFGVTLSILEGANALAQAENAVRSLAPPRPQCG